MDPVRQNSIQRTVRSVHVRALHCVQLLHTTLHRTDLIIFPLILQTITIAPMVSIWGKGYREQKRFKPNVKCQRVLVLALCLVYFCPLVLSLRLKITVDRHSFNSVIGSWFHTHTAPRQKMHVLHFSVVTSKWQNHCELMHVVQIGKRFLWPVSAGLQCTAWSHITLWTKRQSLYLILTRTSSQRNSQRALVTWSPGRISSMTHAAMFRTLCSGANVVTGRPARMALQ